MIRTRSAKDALLRGALPLVLILMFVLSGVGFGTHGPGLDGRSQSAARSPHSPSVVLGHPPRTPAAISGPTGAALQQVNLSMVILHRAININEVLNITVPWPGYHPHVSWDWSGLPVGCHAGSNGSQVLCHPKVPCPGKFRICWVYVNGTDQAHGQIGYAVGNVTVNPPLLAQVEMNATKGQVPFRATLYVNISGGSAYPASGPLPVYSINWLTGDGNIGATRWWNHTYTASGNFTAQVWVNDTTAPFDSLGVVYANVSIVATPAPGKPGPFGLKGNQGWIVIGALAVALLAAAAYGVATRNEPLRLPPPEPWMFPPDESIRNRPKRPPPGGNSPAPPVNK